MMHFYTFITKTNSLKKKSNYKKIATHPIFDWGGLPLLDLNTFFEQIFEH